VESYKEVINDSSYFGWKFINIYLKFLKYLNDGNYYLISSLLRGKFGVRSLFGTGDFDSEQIINNNIREIYIPNKSKTWFGRIKTLFDNISESRIKFESAPDIGILGKNFTRIFNLIKNYFIKGILGTIFIFPFSAKFVIITKHLFNYLVIFF